MSERVGPRECHTWSCLSCAMLSLQDGDYVCLHPQAPRVLIGKHWVTPQWCPVAPWNQQDKQESEVSK